MRYIFCDLSNDKLFEPANIKLNLKSNKDFDICLFYVLKMCKKILKQILGKYYGIFDLDMYVVGNL